MDRSRGIIIGFVAGILVLTGLLAGGFIYFSQHAPSAGSSASVSAGAGSNLVPVSGVSPLICVKDSLDLFGRMPDKSRAELSALLLDGVSRDIFKEYLAYRKDPSQEHAKKLQELASQRKKLLVETLQRDPDAAFRSALSKDEHDALAALTQNCIEMAESAEGKLMMRHVDVLDGTSQDSYYLLGSDGKRVTMHPAFGMKFTASEGNRSVRVFGFRVDDHIFFDGNDPASIVSVDTPQSFFGAQAHAALSNLGPQRVVVILANFQNTAQPSLNAAQVQNTVFTQVNNYYNENSFNKVSLTGSIFGWYTIPINQTCDDIATTNAAVASADPFIDYTQFDRLIVVAPMGPGCAYSGITTIGGGNIFMTADGTMTLSSIVIVASYGTDASAYAHELGHDFGVHHANFYDCGSNSLSGTCASVEYGSLYSTMGNNHPMPRHMNAPEKKMIGWFGASNILDVTANGTYTLAPIETATSALQALRVERDAVTWPLNGGLYLEYRQALGFDSGISGTDAFTGALANTAAVNSMQTQLIDPTPPGNVSTAALTVGTTLTDPLTGDTFTTTAANPAGVTVAVTLCKTDFTAPTVSVTSPGASATVSGTITVSANASDASGIKKVEFYTNSGMTPFAIATALSYTAPLDTTTLPNGNNYISVRAYDLSGQACGAAVSGNVGVSPSLLFTVLNTSDTIPPAVSLTAPTNGATLAYPFTVSANASDNIGIHRVEFYLDSNTVPFHIKTISPYSFFVNNSFLVPTGSHTLYAKAYDLQGNSTASSAASITVNGTDITPPNISFMAPANNAVVSGTIAVSVNATDNIGVTKVEFYKDADVLPFAALAAAPYATTLDTTTLGAGAHALKAKAYDTAGNIGQPVPVPITVDNSPPTVTLIAPANGASVSGAAVALSATASDNVAVQHVDFYRDGAILLSTDMTSPYGFAWNSTTVANGNHTLFAKAVDTAGNAVNSAAITIAVNNASIIVTPPPTTGPSISTGSVSVSGTIDVAVAVTESVSVTKVEFYADASTVPFATVPASPFTAKLNTATLSSGAHTVKAKIYYANGQVSATTGISIMVP